MGNTAEPRVKRITLATLKSFIRRKKGNLYICQKSRFDGMSDCVMPLENGSRFEPVSYEDHKHNMEKNTLGICGVWLVEGRNSIQPYHMNGWKGFQVYNACGSFIIAVREENA